MGRCPRLRRSAQALAELSLPSFLLVSPLIRAVQGTTGVSDQVLSRVGWGAPYFVWFLGSRISVARPGADSVTANPTRSNAMGAAGTGNSAAPCARSSNGSECGGEREKQHATLHAAQGSDEAKEKGP